MLYKTDCMNMDKVTQNARLEIVVISTVFLGNGDESGPNNGKVNYSSNMNHKTESYRCTQIKD